MIRVQKDRFDLTTIQYPCLTGRGIGGGGRYRAYVERESDRGHTGLLFCLPMVSAYTYIFMYVYIICVWVCSRDAYCFFKRLGCQVSRNAVHFAVLRARVRVIKPQFRPSFRYITGYSLNFFYTPSHTTYARKSPPLRYGNDNVMLYEGLVVFAIERQTSKRVLLLTTQRRKFYAGVVFTTLMFFFRSKGLAPRPGATRSTPR